MLIACGHWVWLDLQPTQLTWASPVCISMPTLLGSNWATSTYRFYDFNGYLKVFITFLSGRGNFILQSEDLFHLFFFHCRLQVSSWRFAHVCCRALEIQDKVLLKHSIPVHAKCYARSEHHFICFSVCCIRYCCSCCVVFVVMLLNLQVVKHLDHVPASNFFVFLFFCLPNYHMLVIEALSIFLFV